LKKLKNQFGFGFDLDQPNITCEIQGGVSLLQFDF